MGFGPCGLIAQYFLQKYPDKVKHVVLAYSVALGAGSERTLFKGIRLLRVVPFPLIRAMLKWRIPSSYNDSEWLEFTKAYFEELIATVDKHALLTHWQALKEASRGFTFEPEALGSWSGEMLLLSSLDDKESVGKIEELKARYPRARIHFFSLGGEVIILPFSIRRPTMQ